LILAIGIDTILAIDPEFGMVTLHFEMFLYQHPQVGIILQE
jgi:hypothetical protein